MRAPTNIPSNKKQQNRIATNGFQVLLVDDSATILNVMSMILRRIESLHLTVESSPHRALQLIINQPDHFDLLIIDYRMPFMNGVELAGRARAITQSMCIVGVTTTPAAMEGNPNFKHVLPKPFSPEELIDLVSNHMPQIQPHTNQQPNRPRSFTRTSFPSSKAHTVPLPI